MAVEIVKVLRGRSFRDTLFGKVRYGQAVIKDSSGNQQEISVVIKEYDRQLVEKRMTKNGELVGEDAKEELRIHSLLCNPRNAIHPHIVQLFDVRKDENYYYAILEYCSRGEFFPLVQHPQFTEQYARHYFKQLILGIQHMHDNCNIAHRDLSLENILLDGNSNLKICDFGVAIECKPGTLIKDEPGPPVGKIKFYMPPEVFARQAYSPHLVDVWTSGIILFVMLTKVHPFKYATPADQRFLMVYNGQINDLLGRWQKELLAPAPLNLLQRMLAPPEKRISIKEILKHPYLQDNYQIPIQMSNNNTNDNNSNNTNNNNFIDNAMGDEKTTLSHMNMGLPNTPNTTFSSAVSTNMNDTNTNNNNINSSGNTLYNNYNNNNNNTNFNNNNSNNNNNGNNNNSNNNVLYQLQQQKMMKNNNNPNNNNNNNNDTSMSD